MRRLKWLVQLCFIWHVIRIIKPHGEMLSKENIFQLLKHPTVPRNDDGSSNITKIISKICYNHNDTLDGDNKDTKATTNSSIRDNNTVKILNIFKNILKHFQKRKCEPSHNNNEVQNKRSGDLQFVTQKQQEPNNQENQFVEQQHFSILQQLRLEEQKQKWQQQQLEMQKQQNALRLQNILQHVENESFSKADKKKRKKKRKRRRKKKKKPNEDKKKKRKKKKQKPTSLLAHPAQILFASPTQKPHFYNQQHGNDHYSHQQTNKITTTTTTQKPFSQHPLIPIKKIKYILRKNTIFKKKKKEYLNHLKHVLYPFVKFIAFFTIINPFTLVVFLFSLVSPVIFGFLGFISLSFFIKPALNFLFSVKHTVNAIKRRKLQQLRKRQRLRDSRRPVTIHKHYYQQKPISPPPAPHRHHPPWSPQPHPPALALKQKGPVHNSLSVKNPHHQHPLHIREIKLFNPLLPDVRQKLKKDKYFIPDIKGHNDSFEQF